MELDGQVKPSGPHHFLKYSGSVKAFHTVLAGNLKTRNITISFCTAVSSRFFVFVSI
jgi:hypothetical protein